MSITINYIDYVNIDLQSFVLIYCYDGILKLDQKDIAAFPISFLEDISDEKSRYRSTSV